MSGKWYNNQDMVFSLGSDAFYVAKQTAKAYKYCGFENVDGYIKLFNKQEKNNPKGLVYNEVIPQWTKRKIHFDIDYDGKYPFDIDEFLRKFIECIAKEIEKLTSNTLDGKDIWVLDSSGKNKDGNNKISLHIIINNYHMETCEQMRNFSEQVMSHFIPLLSIETYHWKSVVDMGIYQSKRQFRIAYNTKYGEERYLTPRDFLWNDITYHHDDDKHNVIKSTLITHISESSQLLHYDEVVEKKEVYLSDLSPHEYESALKIFNDYFSDNEKRAFSANGVNGRYIVLKRVDKGWCRICSRSHEGENSSLYVDTNGNVIIKCWRNKAKFLYIGSISQGVETSSTQASQIYLDSKHKKESNLTSSDIISYLVSEYGIITDKTNKI